MAGVGAQRDDCRQAEGAASGLQVPGVREKLEKLYSTAELETERRQHREEMRDMQVRQAELEERVRELEAEVQRPMDEGGGSARRVCPPALCLTAPDGPGLIHKHGHHFVAHKSTPHRATVAAEAARALRKAGASAAAELVLRHRPYAMPLSPRAGVGGGTPREAMEHGGKAGVTGQAQQRWHSGQRLNAAPHKQVAEYRRRKLLLLSVDFQDQMPSPPSPPNNFLLKATMQQEKSNTGHPSSSSADGFAETKGARKQVAAGGLDEESQFPVKKEMVGEEGGHAGRGVVEDAEFRKGVLDLLQMPALSPFSDAMPPHLRSLWASERPGPAVRGSEISALTTGEALQEVSGAAPASTDLQEGGMSLLRTLGVPQNSPRGLKGRRVSSHAATPRSRSLSVCLSGCLSFSLPPPPSPPPPLYLSLSLSLSIFVSLACSFSLSFLPHTQYACSHLYITGRPNVDKAPHLPPLPSVTSVLMAETRS